jgi:hypothetical protein
MLMIVYLRCRCVIKIAEDITKEIGNNLQRRQIVISLTDAQVTKVCRINNTQSLQLIS